jgi:hypothetical protein
MDPEQMAEVIQTLLARGFQYPLYLSAVAVNGQVLVMRYAQTQDDAIEVTTLAEHDEAPGFVLPINLMITDRRGAAARVVIRRPDAWHFAERN